MFIYLCNSQICFLKWKMATSVFICLLSSLTVPFTLKGVGICFSMLKFALCGNYVNFGVFRLYGDDALDSALSTFIKMLLSISQNDLLVGTASHVWLCLSVVYFLAMLMNSDNYISHNITALCKHFNEIGCFSSSAVRALLCKPAGCEFKSSLNLCLWAVSPESRPSAMCPGCDQSQCCINHPTIISIVTWLDLKIKVPYQCQFHILLISLFLVDTVGKFNCL